MPAQTVIKFRRDTAANWTTTNPVLAAGEVGLETDTGLVKYGNGTLTWTALSYPSNSNITYLVRNNTASTILKGTLVAATGAEPSGRIDVAPFETTGLQDSELRVMGIATANIASGVNGTVMSFGTLTGLDTRGTAASGLAVGDEDWTVGTILFAHPTVPGKLTSVRPKHDLAVAFTTVRHATAGQISIRIVPGNFHLEWMHDVAISSPATGQVLQYDGTDWVNADIEVPPGTTVSETAPASPEEGQMWWNSDSGTLYIYYDSVWVEAAAGVTGPEGPQGIQGPAGNDGALSPNYIINGAFDIFQRGTSFAHTASLIYGADRWGFYRGGFATGATTSRQTTSLDNFQFATRVQRDSGNTSTAGMNFTQPMETSEIIRIRGQQVTISFFARAGANFSASSNTLSSIFDAGTGTNETGWVGFTSAIGYSQTHTLTSDWQRFTHTFTLANTRTSGALRFGFNPVGTAGANDWYEITGVQLEAGSVATPFKRHAPSLQGELAACQRYYFRQTANASNRFAVFGSGHANSSTTVSVVVQLKQTMRAVPTLSTGGAFQVLSGGLTSSMTPSALNSQQGVDTAGIGGTVSGFTAGQATFLRANDDPNAFIDFSAEL